MSEHVCKCNVGNSPDYGSPVDYPEKYGLRIFRQVGEQDWEWNLVLVLEDEKTHELFYALGSGCSCNSLGEDYPNRASLKPITEETLGTFIRESHEQIISEYQKDAERQRNEVDLVRMHSLVSLYVLGTGA